MILIGYQGVGKSTLSNGTHKYIDLESSNFWVDGKRNENWHMVYCNIANHLSEQGYSVFTASHAVVREQLSYSKERKIIMCPSIDLKEEWTTRLVDRYLSTRMLKDYKALENARDRYVENISELLADKRFEHLVITEIPYNLHNMIVDLSKKKVRQ